MKKIFTYFILIAFTYILISISIGCKSRKLSKSSSTVEDKSNTEQVSRVKQESQTTAARTKVTESAITDQSGTWIWEEWYQRDKSIDTIIPGLIFKRTTFVKNDINKVDKQEISDFENHSELKDSVGNLAVQNDIKIQEDHKELDAKKDSNWIWPLTGLFLIIVALIFIIKK